jgi:hypothetical protein
MANDSTGELPLEPTADRLIELMQLRLTTDERLECERAADNAGEPISEWIRVHLIRAAKRALNGE